MTKQEARAIARAMNEWRRKEYDSMSMSARQYCTAIDVLTQPSDSLQMQSRTFMLFVAEALES